MKTTNVRIRGYQGGDEQSLIDCWNASLPYDTIDERVFVRKVLCDGNFDPEGLIVAEGPHTEIVGFVLVLACGSDPEPQEGWITAFAVSPAWRRQGIGRALFAAADQFLVARGRKQVSFAPYAPHYFVPGIDAEHYPEGTAFLSAMGFDNLYPCVSMDMSIPLFVIPDAVQATVRERQQEGYRFEPLSLPYVRETIDLAHNHFHADWGRAVREALASGVSYNHFRIAIDPHDAVVGFCMWGAYDHSPDRFGPFGVLQKERGKGLGKVLLYLGLEAMRTMGVHDAWFLWTGENSPAGRLYTRAGFTVTRRFTVMRKQLTQG